MAFVHNSFTQIFFEDHIYMAQCVKSVHMPGPRASSLLGHAISEPASYWCSGKSADEAQVLGSLLPASEPLMEFRLLASELRLAQPFLLGPFEKWTSTNQALSPLLLSNSYTHTSLKSRGSMRSPGTYGRELTISRTHSMIRWRDGQGLSSEPT